MSFTNYLKIDAIQYSSWNLDDCFKFIGANRILSFDKSTYKLVILDKKEKTVSLNEWIVKLPEILYLPFNSVVTIDSDMANECFMVLSREQRVNLFSDIDKLLHSYSEFV